MDFEGDKGRELNFRGCHTSSQHTPPKFKSMTWRQFCIIFGSIAFGFNTFWLFMYWCDPKPQLGVKIWLFRLQTQMVTEVLRLCDGKKFKESVFRHCATTNSCRVTRLVSNTAEFSSKVNLWSWSTIIVVACGFGSQKNCFKMKLTVRNVRHSAPKPTPTRFRHVLTVNNQNRNIPIVFERNFGISLSTLIWWVFVSLILIPLEFLT
jgi:hypothetical protein